MLSALNFCSKAATELRAHPFDTAPLSKIGARWVAELLDQAEIFVLPDGGRLLARASPKPEVPGMVFQPKFPVLACEYVSTVAGAEDPYYSATRCPRRIALAWDWESTKPAHPLFGHGHYGPGVGIISVFFVECTQLWMCNSVAFHVPYDGEWRPGSELHRMPYQESVLGRNAAMRAASGYPTNIVPVLIEQLSAVALASGPEASIDVAMSDNSDEFLAYIDLCYALACKNVAAEKKSASKVVNGVKRRPDLRDFHVLSLDGDQHAMAVPTANRTEPRPHLRRGHLRRISPERITWVNQTMVRSRPGHGENADRMQGAA